MFSWIKEKLERELREDITDKRCYFGGLALIMEVVLKALIDNYTLSATLLHVRGQPFSPLVGFNVFCSADCACDDLVHQLKAAVQRWAFCKNRADFAESETRAVFKI